MAGVFLSSNICSTSVKKMVDEDPDELDDSSLLDLVSGQTNLGVSGAGRAVLAGPSAARSPMVCRIFSFLLVSTCLENSIVHTQCLDNTKIP